jgi:hypothetical protein
MLELARQSQYWLAQRASGGPACRAERPQERAVSRSAAGAFVPFRALAISGRY